MIRINLAPAEARRGPGFGFSFALPAFNLGIAFGIVYLAVIGGIAVYWVGLRTSEARLTAAIETGTKELSQHRATLGAGAGIKTQVADMKKRIQLIEDLVKDQGRPIALFDAFADTIPRDLWITGFEERSSNLKLTGTAYSTIAVSDFMTNLRSSGKFKDIEIIVSRQDLAKVPSFVTFEVTCRFQG